MEKSSKVYVGMDVHKESIDVTLAEQGGELRRLGQIGGDRGSLLKMVRRQQSKGAERCLSTRRGRAGSGFTARSLRWASAAWWCRRHWYRSARAIM